MRLADSRNFGIFPLQHKKFKSKNWDLQLRASIFGVRITDRYMNTGDIGHWEFDKNSLGDIHGGQLWNKDSRDIPMWRFATPVKIGGKPAANNDVATPSDNPNRPGGGGSARPTSPGSTNGPGGIGGGLASNNPGYNASGGNAIGSSGGPSDIVLGGAGAGQSRPTVFEEATPGGSRPGDTTSGDRPGEGGGGGASPPTCGTSPDGDFIMFPILDKDYTADERLKELKPAIFKVDGKRAWPKFPKGSVGISLIADEEENQVDLFHPTDPRLVAVNKAGDKDMGSLVFDLTKDFEFDKDRGVPLQSMMWVLKKPLGASNAIAWQLGPSGCKDTRGGYVMDDSTGGAGVAQSGAGAGQSRPTVVEEPGGGKQSKVVARASRNNGGPFDVGSGKCRHVLGRDADGNPIARLHFDINTLFRQDDGQDGPLNVTNWKKGEAQDKKVPVNFGWNGAAQKWDWWTTTYVHFPPTTPPPYPPYPPVTPPLNYDQVNVGPVGTPVTTPGGSTGGNIATGGGAHPPSPFNIWDALNNTLYGDGNLPGTPPIAPPGGTTGGGTGNTGGPAGGPTATGGGTGAPNNPGPGAGQGNQPPVVNPDGTTPSDPEPPTGTQDWADWNKRRKQRREDFPGGNLMGSMITSPQGYAMIDQALATGQLLAKPYNNYPNMPNFANMPQIPASIASKYAMTNPITAQMTAFGAQGGPSTAIAANPPAPTPPSSLPPASPNPSATPVPSPTPAAPPSSPTVTSPAPSPVTTTAKEVGATGDPWDYTWKPQANTNYNGGTSPGGWTFNPPEVPFSSWPDDQTPLEGQGAVSETFIGAGPGASFFAGAADVATGKPKNCMSWAKDTASGDLVFKAHYGGSDAGIEAVRFSHMGQNISFAARAGVLGTLTHFNSAARTWQFPDISGQVLAVSNHDAVGWSTQATLHTIGGSGPTVANQDSWARIKINGTTFWLPLWR